jgi:protoporphyrinogen/coproporphyrinogen III oxidase
MVVNLYYANPSLLPVHGFGYLIPRSVTWDQNPERALGVVFDSDASPFLDTAPGTKVTVMLGGHWWDGWDAYPDEAEGVAMAKAILKRHLKIEEEPTVVNVGLHRECIPQYTVGHEERMGKAHEELTKTFKGKLAVAGSSYTGISVNDCVRSARDLVGAIKSQGLGRVTGLERFLEPFGNRWVVAHSMSLWERVKATIPTMTVERRDGDSR